VAHARLVAELLMFSTAKSGHAMKALKEMGEKAGHQRKKR
jgi:hypothetical protein